MPLRVHRVDQRRDPLAWTTAYVQGRRVREAIEATGARLFRFTGLTFTRSSSIHKIQGAAAQKQS